MNATNFSATHIHHTMSIVYTVFKARTPPSFSLFECVSESDDLFQNRTESIYVSAYRIGIV